MSYKTLSLTVENRIAHVQFTRPKELNSLNPDWWVDIGQVFDDIEERGDVRCVVISSTGKHFTAGLDLKSFSSLAASDQDPTRRREAFRHHVRWLHSRLDRIEKCRIPVIAAVHGGCVGGGVDLTCCADFRVCTKDAFFTIHEINIGMAADVGTLQRMPHIVGSGMMRELAYTGRRFYGDEAKAIGYVNHVYDTQSAMMTAVMEMAKDIASKSPMALHGTKEMLNYARDHSVEEGLNYIAIWNAAMLVDGDIREGVTAQAEKRQADYADMPKILER